MDRRSARLRIGVLASRQGSMMEAVADACAQGRIHGEIVLLGCNRLEAPVVGKAQARGIPTLLVRSSDDPEGRWEETLAAQFRAARVELVILAGFMRILKGPLLDTFEGRIINLHPSLLPKYGGVGFYGTHVHEAVLRGGDPITGSTVFLVTKEVDRGPTILQRSIEVRKGESPEELSERQKPMERELLVEVVRKFAAGEFPLPWHDGALTYAQAGVDTQAVRESLGALVKALKFRPPPSHGQPLGGIGLFAGVVRLGDRFLALTTDNVGTKVLLAEEADRWEEVGEDMVAINVNDLLAAGAVPSALVDYIVTRRPDGRVLARIGKGLNAGLARAGASLLGGETAVAPEILQASYDLSATALGFYPKGRMPLNGGRIMRGDVLLGIPSSGFHANGFTLVRRLVKEGRLSLVERLPGMRVPLGKALLAPTRTYVGSVEPLLGKDLPVGLAHITGGAFAKNLLRLRRDLEFELDGLPEPHGLFAWVSEASRLPAEELYRTFNMGIGFVVAVRPEDEKEALGVLRSHGARDARVVGQVNRGKGVSLPGAGVRYTSY